MEYHVLDKARQLIAQLGLKESELAYKMRIRLFEIDHYGLPEVLNNFFKEYVELKLSTLEALKNLDYKRDDLISFTTNTYNHFRLKDNYNKYLNTLEDKFKFIVITTLNKKLPDFEFLSLNINNIIIDDSFKKNFMTNFLLGIEEPEKIILDDIEMLSEKATEEDMKYASNKDLLERLVKEFKIKDDDFKYIGKEMNSLISEYCGGRNNISPDLIREFFEQFPISDETKKLLGSITIFDSFAYDMEDYFNKVVDRFKELIENKLLEDVAPEEKLMFFDRVVVITTYLFKVVANLRANSLLNIKEFFDIAKTEIDRAEDYLFNVAKIAQGIEIEKE